MLNWIIWERFKKKVNLGLRNNDFLYHICKIKATIQKLNPLHPISDLHKLRIIFRIGFIGPALI